MKKTIPLIILLTSLVGNAQCPAPSNLTLTILNATSAQLSWTEYGAANTWEIAIIPDFNVGIPLPSDVLYITASNAFIITGLSPSMGCNVFFVRSACSATNVSAWITVGTLGCDTNTNNYLAALLSNDNFNFENSVLQIFPNPSTNIVQLKSNAQIDKITVFDSLGKIILIQTQNNNQIDVAHLSKGFYVIEVVAGNKKMYSKFIKE